VTNIVTKVTVLPIKMYYHVFFGDAKMATIVKQFDETTEVNFHDSNSEAFEFISIPDERNPGTYISQFTVFEEPVAYKMKNGQWKIWSKAIGKFIDGWTDLSKSEKIETLDTIQECIHRMEGESFGKVNSIPDPQTEAATPKQLTAADALGHNVEVLSLNPDFEDKLFKIKATFSGMTGMQEFGLSYWKPPGGKGGGFMNLFRRRKGLPKDHKYQWESVKMKSNGNNASSMIAMKRYDGTWSFSPAVYEWFEAQTDGDNGELDHNQICSEYPNNLFVQLFHWGE